LLEPKISIYRTRPEVRTYLYLYP